MTSQEFIAADVIMSDTSSSYLSGFRDEIGLPSDRDAVEEAGVHRNYLGVKPYQFEPEYSTDEDLEEDLTIDSHSDDEADARHFQDVDSW